MEELQKLFEACVCDVNLWIIGNNSDHLNCVREPKLTLYKSGGGSWHITGFFEGLAISSEMSRVLDGVVITLKERMLMEVLHG